MNPDDRIRIYRYMYGKTLAITAMFGGVDEPKGVIRTRLAAMMAFTNEDNPDGVIEVLRADLRKYDAVAASGTNTESAAGYSEAEKAAAVRGLLELLVPTYGRERVFGSDQ